MPPLAATRNSILPPRGRKYDQVLEGARQVFMADGFEGASVDEIARVAEVSKATLYKYFADKRMLFMEVANNECQRQAGAALDNIVLAAPKYWARRAVIFWVSSPAVSASKFSAFAWQNQIASPNWAAAFMNLVRR